MKKIDCILFVGVLAVLAGCSSTMKLAKEYRPGTNDVFSYEFQYKESVVVSEEAKIIMKNRIESELSKRGMLASSEQQDSKRIEIIFNNYNMRSGGARFWAGVLAGTDIIDTLVLVKSSDGGDILGEFVVESKNNTAWGTSQGLIEGHADKIIKYLAGAKK